jgi:hypothetical protein
MPPELHKAQMEEQLANMDTDPNVSVFSQQKIEYVFLK